MSSTINQTKGRDKIEHLSDDVLISEPLVEALEHASEDSDNDATQTTKRHHGTSAEISPVNITLAENPLLDELPYTAIESGSQGSILISLPNLASGFSSSSSEPTQCSSGSSGSVDSDSLSLLPRFATTVLQKPIHAILSENPHIQQRQHMKIVAEKSPQYLETHQLKRVLEHWGILPTSKYQIIPHDQRTVNHWGQRKLLLSEIEFLTIYLEKFREMYKGQNKKAVVVYAGAAPGNHIPYLLKLFKSDKEDDLELVLYDPASFNIEEQPGIKINPQESGQKQGFFNDEVAAYYYNLAAEGNIVTLFISDIRTGDPKCMSPSEIEQAVERDMQWQETWIRKMRPLGSMLKFRLPWKEGVTRYVEGSIYLPVWGPQTTTETRLIVDIAQLDIDNEYNHKLYEEQMFWWNTRTRVDYYEHPYKVQGLDHCYDCAAEALLLENYLNKIKHRDNPLSQEQLLVRVPQMIQEISTEISKGRRLDSKIQLHQRKNWFEPRRYDTTNFQITKAERKRPAPELPLRSNPASSATVPQRTHFQHRDRKVYKQRQNHNSYSHYQRPR